MKERMNAVRLFFVLAGFLAVVTFPTGSSANHSWNGYHWARTSNPFTVKLGDNLSSNWKSYLSTASSDWSQSTVMDTTIVAGQAGNKNCRKTTGRVEVCNGNYGYNGWLGVASINVSGSHITAGSVKLNDSYFNTSTYNSPSWRQLVTCQEVGHTFGLDHQDEVFDNPNLGTCMDYTNNPTGPPSNLHPNKHDYDELVTIYSHTDSTTTVGAATPRAYLDIDSGDPREWGDPIEALNDGKIVLFERNLGNDHRVFTFVYWAEEPRGNRPD